MVKRKLHKIIKEYITLIREKGYDVYSAYLFGSYALNKENEDSDIDIAVILNKESDYFDTRVNLMKLRRNIDLKIEPHPIFINDFNEHYLFKEITQNGIKIKI